MRHLIRLIALPLLAAVAVLTLAHSAEAVKWKSIDDPLRVYEDGVGQGEAYGNFYNYGQVVARSLAYFADMKPGGNAVRVETDFYWYGTNALQCGAESPNCFWFDISKQTEETTSSSWVRDYRDRGLHGTSWRARGRIDICEIQAWSNDPCSAKVYPTFDY